MSTNNRIRVMIGLTVIGSFGWATVRDHADADEPRGSSSNSAVASNAPERYLMLTNGRIIKGVITEETTQYLVGQPIGVMHFAKREVEGAFNTVHEAYEHRLEQLPERDADERMKLAYWCLNLNLKTEAREQLERVLELNSKHTQAKAMLFSMKQSAAIVAQRQHDPGVRQTGGEETMKKDDRPKALDSAVLQRAQRGLNVVGTPVIFDLPTPLAIKRYNEFCRFVQPVLQHYCAKCHDGNYDGDFQIVSIKGRNDWTVDALRANLDATLRLIDQENPSKSELLTSTLRAHGRGQHPRSIFPGSNDLTYKILATWVQSLRDTKSNREANQTKVGRSEPENTESFATGRDRIAGDNPEAVMTALANDGRRPTAGPSLGAQIPPPSRFVPGNGANTSAPNQAAPDDFPLPFVLTGKMPALAPAGPASGSTPKSARTGASSPSGATDGVRRAPNATGDAAKTDDQAKAAGEPGAPKKKTKPLSIDPSLLERALLNRNNPR